MAAVAGHRAVRQGLLLAGSPAARRPGGQEARHRRPGVGTATGIDLPHCRPWKYRVTAFTPAMFTSAADILVSINELTLINI